jgi:hypothetical protein
VFTLTSHYLTRSSPLDPYLKLARWIARSEDPFTNFYSIFDTGMREEGYDPGSDEEEDENDTRPQYVIYSTYFLCLCIMHNTWIHTGLMKNNASDYCAFTNLSLTFPASSQGSRRFTTAQRCWKTFARR